MTEHRLRVAHSLESVSFGGVERRHLQLCMSSSHSHRVVCTKARGPLADQFSEIGVDLTTLGETSSFRLLGRAAAARIALRAWQPDIIHGSVMEGYTSGTIAGRWLRTPAIIMEETSDPANRRSGGHALARTMASLADHCIAVSPAVGRYLTEDLRIPAKKVSVISNGVPTPAQPTAVESQSLRKSVGIAEGAVVGTVGRMREESHKRFGDLLQAFALLDATPLPHLVLVGDGPERPGLEQFAQDLGITARVHFVGFQAEPGRFYALMDIFALTSEREAFGLVNAEAMRCGLPVVATRVGGIPDVVTHDHTGILVPPRNIPAITHALQTLIDNPDLRHRMGTAGKQRADTHFSAERYVNDVHDLYQHLLTNPPRNRRHLERNR